MHTPRYSVACFLCLQERVTDENSTSSRSHAMLSIFIRRTQSTPQGAYLPPKLAKSESKICLVDLAGSERYAKEEKKMRILEDSSCGTLSTFTISAVCDASHCQHKMSRTSENQNYRQHETNRKKNRAMNIDGFSCLLNALLWKHRFRSPSCNSTTRTFKICCATRLLHPLAI